MYTVHVVGNYGLSTYNEPLLIKKSKGRYNETHFFRVKLAMQNFAPIQGLSASTHTRIETESVNGVDLT